MRSCEEAYPSESTLLRLLLRSRSDSSCNSQLIRDFATREFNAFLWLALITITFLLLTKLFKLLRLWSKARNIPGPPSPSFYGHCKLISRENFTDLLSESHEKYGSIVKLWLGPTQLLVSLKDPVLIKDMLLKAEDKLPLTGRAFRLAFGQAGFFASSFEKVRRRKELLATELNGRLLERADLIPTKVVDFMKERVDNIMNKGSVDCKIFSQHMAFTVMGATLFGDDFLAWSKAAVYEELLMMIAKDAGIWASYSVTPVWKQGFWRYLRLCKKLKTLTHDIIQHCRENCKLFHGMDENVCYESMGIKIDTKAGAKSSSDTEKLDYFPFCNSNGWHNTRDEPCGNIMGVMYHGCLTTAALISNTLTRLVTHPEIQEKVYSEIIKAQSNSSKPDLQNVYNMPLLLAAVYESARLLPTGPLLQRYLLKNDLYLETGVTIPAGAVVVVPIQLVQMDDSSWGSDARNFNPYRFLTNSPKGCAEELRNPGLGSHVLNDPNKNVAFLPFGAGTRACVGQKFIIHGVATLLASLLEKYEMRLHLGSETDQKPRLDTSLSWHTPISHIAFLRRNM